MYNANDESTHQDVTLVEATSRFFFFFPACKKRICAQSVVGVGYMNKSVFLLFVQKIWQNTVLFWSSVLQGLGQATGASH